MHATTSKRGTPVKCIRGNATIKADTTGHVPSIAILTGKRRKWDLMSWSLMDGNKISVQGLYRGHYCDAVTTDDELISALESLNSEAANRVIEDIRKARI